MAAIDFGSLVEKLEKALQLPLPGKEAHRKMMPVVPGNRIEYFTNETLRPAAVLICLFPLNNRMHTIFIERTQDAGPHSGQIAFPGGRFEDSDDSLMHTALREANEELGIITEQVYVLGKLSAIQIPVSGFSVLPVIAVAQQQPIIEACPDEVKSYFTCDLLELFSNKGHGKIVVRDFSIEAAFYKYNEKTIWGATAMLLSELESLLINS